MLSPSPTQPPLTSRSRGGLGSEDVGKDHSEPGGAPRLGWGDVSADPAQEAGTSFAQRTGRGDPVKVRGGFSFLLICPPGFTSSHHRLSKKATLSLPGHTREAGPVRDSESSPIPAAPPGGAAAWHPRPWPHLPERLRLSARRAPRQRGGWSACSPDRQLENTNKTEGKEINNKERARKPKKIQFPGSGKLGACSLARPRAFGTGTGALCAAFGHPLRAPS